MAQFRCTTLCCDTLRSLRALPRQSGPELTPTGALKPPGEDEPREIFTDETTSIETGLGNLLKPLNAQAGVTVEPSVGRYVVLVIGIVGLFFFYALLLAINNQSILLPPEDEYDEYVANFLPYFFFGDKQ